MSPRPNSKTAKFSLLRLAPKLILLLALIPGLAKAQLATPNAAGLTYGHVHLNVSDLELHKKLWVEHFDAEVVVKGPLTSVRTENMVIIFTEQEPTQGSRGTVMDHFGFKVRNIETFLEKWRAAGYEVGPEFIGAEGQKNAYVTMPGGAYVELQEDQQLSREISSYHIHFFTREAEQLLNWYSTVFDLEIRPRGSIATTTNVPGMNMSFAKTDDDRVATRGTAIDHIGFEVDDLESFVKGLESKGITLDVPVRDIPAIGLKIAFFTDPAGTTIELTEGLHDY